MLNYTVKDLGEVSLFVNKGAIGEWESHFDKSWIEILIGTSNPNIIVRALSGGMNSDKWFVLLHKCYQVACYRNRTVPSFTLNDFKGFIDTETFNKMISDVWPLVQEVVEFEKVMESLNKINEETAKLSKKKK